MLWIYIFSPRKGSTLNETIRRENRWTHCGPTPKHELLPPIRLLLITVRPHQLDCTIARRRNSTIIVAEKDKASSDARLNTSSSTNDNDFEKEATRSSRPTVKLVVHPKCSSSKDATARARYLVCLHLLLEEDHPSYQIHQSRSSLSDVQAIMDNLNWCSDYLHASHIPSAFLRQSQKEIAYH